MKAPAETGTGRCLASRPQADPAWRALPSGAAGPLRSSQGRSPRPGSGWSASGVRALWGDNWGALVWVRVSPTSTRRKGNNEGNDVPGLKVIRQVLLVQVPSGKIIILK